MRILRNLFARLVSPGCRHSWDYSSRKSNVRECRLCGCEQDLG